MKYLQINDEIFPESAFEQFSVERTRYGIGAFVWCKQSDKGIAVGDISFTKIFADHPNLEGVTEEMVHKVADDFRKKWITRFQLLSTNWEENDILYFDTDTGENCIIRYVDGKNTHLFEETA